MPSRSRTADDDEKARSHPTDGDEAGKERDSLAAKGKEDETTTRADHDDMGGLGMTNVESPGQIR